MTSQERTCEEIEFEVRCPLSGPSLAVIRAFVETVARQMGFHIDDAAKIEMAVDEACANVLLHAYPNSHNEAQCDFTLRLRVSPDAIAIWIIDKGVGSQRGEHKGVGSIREYMNLEKKYHGLGTYIIRSFMDEVEYHFPEEKGTILRMVKYLHAAPQARV